MREFFRALDPTRWAALIGVVLLLILTVVTLSWCNERDRLKQSRQEANVAAATGRALDKVAKETPAIRQDQEEKQRAVDNLEGSDQRLPDGYGRDLECVRRGGC